MRGWYDRMGMQTDFADIYASPVERIVKNIPPERRTMLVHNTCVGPREIDILKAHFGDNLTMALCPRSNEYIGGMQPPAGLLASSGIRIAIGTDSLASNTSLSIVEEMKAIKDIPLETLLQWVTLGGAQALGVDDSYGSLQTGKRPGVVLLEGIDWDTMALLPTASARRLV